MIDWSEALNDVAVVDERGDQACAAVDQLTEATTDAFQAHPHAPVYASFPGCGPLIGARLLAEIGDDLGRFTVRGLRAYAGAAPLTWESSSSRTVRSPVGLRQSDPVTGLPRPLRPSPRAGRPLRRSIAESVWTAAVQPPLLPQERHPVPGRSSIPATLRIEHRTGRA
ncbi:transposase [Streptomyces sp. NPDC056244]|uniref:transposase n=1 Tax=Streptomyces sp. NPDC056244 TaxID=3345762 RepID=UPI0035E2E5E3